MADTSAISAATGLVSYEDYLTSQSRAVSKELGQTEFLQLLVASLQYQDPLEPQSNTDFVGQLSQFNMVDQLTNMNTTMNNSYYYNLVGKYISAEVTFEDGTTGTVSGVVDYVVSKDGTMYAQVNDYLIDASKITQVWDKELFSASNPLFDVAALIGKEVRGYITGTDGEKTEISGTVNRIALNDEGILLAYLDNGKSLPTSAIIDIIDTGIQTTGSTDTTDTTDATDAANNGTDAEDL